MNEIKDMINFLFENKSLTHIDTRDNDFYNGFILELHETFIVLEDRILGRTPIPFSEIKVIEKFRENKK